MTIENCEKQKSVGTLILRMLKILGNNLSSKTTEFKSYLHELRFCCTKEQKVANDYKISQK